MLWGGLQVCLVSVVGVALCAGSVSSPSFLTKKRTCEKDDISFAKMTSQTCTINWALKGAWDRPWKDVKEVGCWDLKVYNTDKFLSSTVYQNTQDHRCALVFSGYHGALAGYIRGAVSLLTPMTTWNMCGYNMYAPYVRLLRHHTTLGNWSKIAQLLGAPETSCKGEITFMAESMGGSSGEIMAACANSGHLDQLQDRRLPQFKIHNIYTFGAPAGSKEPITNILRSDGCFPGKRLFFAGDAIAHAGFLLGLKHPRMDAVEIWPSNKGPTLKAFPCSSKEAIGDLTHQMPPPLNVSHLVRFTGDASDSHMITGYESELEWLNKAGMDEVLDMEPMTNTNAVRYIEQFGRR